MKYINNKSLVLAVILVCIFGCSVWGSSILLAVDTGLENTAKAGGLPNYNIPIILGSLAGGALALSGSVFLFLIVYGGFILLTSQGEKDAITKGKNIIKWAIIGAVILASAYAITNLIFSTLTQSSPKP